MKPASASVVALIALALSSQTALGEIVISDPYVRLSRPNAPVAAAFLVIENTGPEADRLLAAHTDAASRAELHTHKQVGDGIMSMVEIEGGISIAPGQTHALKRGGDHLMLMGLTEKLEQGSAISLVLTFENAGEIRVDVPVDNERKPAQHD